MPDKNDVAPDFELPTQDGTPLKLSDLRGRKVVLYFYPKDDTPGCTKEACGFRDQHKELQRAGATVLGVSPDPIKSHEKFVGKYRFMETQIVEIVLKENVLTASIAGSPELELEPYRGTEFKLKGVPASIEFKADNGTVKGADLLQGGAAFYAEKIE